MQELRNLALPFSHVRKGKYLLSNSIIQLPISRYEKSVVSKEFCTSILQEIVCFHQK